VSRRSHTDPAPADPTEENAGARNDEKVGAASPSESAETEGGLEEVPATSDEVEALRSECADLRDALVRRRADFENYRKRVERDRHNAAQEALASLFRELVATVDNLERALAAEGNGGLLRQGVDLTHRELMGLLEAHGVVALDPAGEAFDPKLHQALLHEPVPGLSEGTVAEVYRKGYMFGDRLLRPALVKVAKGDEADAGSEG